MANTIEIRLDKVSQLFETLDPFPFRERDLGKEAEEYIATFAAELPRNEPFSIVVHLPAGAEASEASRGVEQAIQHFFAYRAERIAREVTDLFRVGRRAFAISLVVLAACLLAGQAFATAFPETRVSHFVEEGLIIIGWVACWRPLEIFLYDWWPPSQQKKLYRRIAAAPVSVRFDTPEAHA